MATVGNQLPEGTCVETFSSYGAPVYHRFSSSFSVYYELLLSRYEPGFRAAQRLGISSHLLARITGCIFIVRGSREQQPDSASKSNIGLNLKFNKRQEEVGPCK